jgi:hypothetical protein
MRVDGFEEKRGKFVEGELVHVVLDLVDGHAGEEQDGEGAAVALDVGEDIEAVGVGHLQVQQEGADFGVFEEVDGGGAVAGFVDLVAGLAEEVRQRHALDGGIVTKQNPRTRLH